MAIEVVSRGRRGRVFVKDEREDGATILLVCEAADDRLDSSEEERLAALQGIIVIPNEPPASDPQHGGYPLGLRDERALEMTIDTTGLDAGTHQFNMGRFASQVITMAEQGVGLVALEADAATEFGMIAERAQA